MSFVYADELCHEILETKSLQLLSISNLYISCKLKYTKKCAIVSIEDDAK
jgi:hypothetical protein